MKVNIYETVEVSDEARKAIAGLLGQKTATRDDLKAFIWKYGAEWEQVAFGEAFTDEDLVGGTTNEADDEDADEDLLGGTTDEDLVGGATDEDLI